MVQCPDYRSGDQGVGNKTNDLVGIYRGDMDQCFISESKAWSVLLITEN